MIIMYKGFKASVTFAPVPGHYVAEVEHGPDLVSFSASTFEELKSVMSLAVENYLNIGF